MRQLGSLGKADLSFAGHSLGGGLASANALATGRAAYTFNAAGLHPNSKILYSLDKKAPITAYVIEGEIVSYSQSLMGLKAEGTIIKLPTSYISTNYLSPNLKSGAVLLNTILRGRNHFMDQVIKKMDEQGIK